MKKLWPYISVFLLGIVGGIVIAIKWLKIDRVVYHVKRLKLKRSPGGQITVDTGTLPESGGIVLKSREERKMDRQVKRVAKKQERLKKQK